MPVFEQGVLAGNLYDKYGTSNPIARYLMNGFNEAFISLVLMSGANDIHEIGCGEGHLSIALAARGGKVRSSDFSTEIIRKAEGNARKNNLEIQFKAASIYDLVPERDSAELVVCCEVLEHLHAPLKALIILEQLARPYLLVSVPREPLWRVLNIARFKYLSSFGNTPGHIQHWSAKAFLDLLSQHFDVIAIRKPIPWTMALCRIRNVRQNRWS